MECLRAVPYSHALNWPPRPPKLGGEASLVSPQPMDADSKSPIAEHPAG
jgi:hypothetical protein